jgi:AmmeMemoRadiSam system protein B
MRRAPAVAGLFYPAQREQLERLLDTCLGPPAAEPEAAVACLVPHAGYIYSGPVAGAVYRRLLLPRRFIILCPRHHPVGQPLAILSSGSWQTPLGDVPVDTALAHAIRQACPLLREDPEAHRLEHSLEVQLPFLQRLLGEFQFVPVALGTAVLAALEELGRAVARVVAEAGEPVLIIASSDMNHYESDAVTRQKDRKAIERILALDPAGLFRTVAEEEISMCGFAAAVAMLTAARELGASRAELVRYATSGDVTGDRSAVVGYAGIVIQ